MRVVTRLHLAMQTRIAWAKQYPSHKPDSQDKQEILARLKALGPCPDPNEVDKVIGNDSWTRLKCHECSDDTLERVVELGEQWDYESNTAHICIPCLQKALNMPAYFTIEYGTDINNHLHKLEDRDMVHAARGADRDKPWEDTPINYEYRRND